MQDENNAVFQMRFPQKLWYLLKLQTEAILWGGTGRTILLNYRILHTYLQCDNSIFKTTNISSFIRQLNLYGFRKVTSHLQDPLCNSSNPFMHEYVHDYFQFGRPDLLNKITRKAITIRKPFKMKNYINDNVVYTPLQKARHAFRMALKKAAEDIFFKSSPEVNFDYEYDDAASKIIDNKDEMELHWFIKKHNEKPNIPITDVEETNTNPEKDTTSKTEENTSSANSVVLTTEPSQQSFQHQFLSMPDLDEPVPQNSSIELLDEFNVERTKSEDLVTNQSEKIGNSLNCVLPSIGSYHMDDMSGSETNQDYYHREWDQMFNDIVADKSSSQEGVTNLRGFYSQITLSTDLLNYS